MNFVNNFFATIFGALSAAILFWIGIGIVAAALVLHLIFMKRKRATRRVGMINLVLAWTFVVFSILFFPVYLAAATFLYILAYLPFAFVVLLAVYILRVIFLKYETSCHKCCNCDKKPLAKPAKQNEKKKSEPKSEKQEPREVKAEKAEPAEKVAKPTATSPKKKTTQKPKPATHKKPRLSPTKKEAPVKKETPTSPVKSENAPQDIVVITPATEPYGIGSHTVQTVSTNQTIERSGTVTSETTVNKREETLHSDGTVSGTSSSTTQSSKTELKAQKANLRNEYDGLIKKLADSRVQQSSTQKASTTNGSGTKKYDEEEVLKALTGLKGAMDDLQRQIDYQDK